MICGLEHLLTHSCIQKSCMSTTLLRHSSSSAKRRSNPTVTMQAGVLKDITSVRAGELVRQSLVQGARLLEYLPRLTNSPIDMGLDDRRNCQVPKSKGRNPHSDVDMISVEEASNYHPAAFILQGGNASSRAERLRKLS